MISSGGNSIHHIPTAKYKGDVWIEMNGSSLSSYVQIPEKIKSYIEPDPFVYPFVRITKIQV